MALTIAKLSPNPDHVEGNKRVHYRKVTFDSSYPDNGEAVTADDFGLTSLEFLEVLGPALKSDEATAYVVGFDHDASKLVVFQGDNDNAADAPLIEVADTTDISAYRVYVKAVGW